MKRKMIHAASAVTAFSLPTLAGATDGYFQHGYGVNARGRADYNHLDNPIRARDVTFNIPAPGVVQQQGTPGVPHALSGGSEITMACMHAFRKSVSGPATNPYFPAGRTETLSMAQNSRGIAWGMKF